MKREQHTETPWRTDYFDVTELGQPRRTGFFIAPSEGYDIAHLQVSSARPKEMQEANARFIITAVNSHASLIEACKKALTCASLNSDVRALIVSTLQLAEAGAVAGECNCPTPSFHAANCAANDGTNGCNGDALAGEAVSDGDDDDQQQAEFQSKLRDVMLHNPLVKEVDLDSVK